MKNNKIKKAVLLLGIGAVVFVAGRVSSPSKNSHESHEQSASNGPVAKVDTLWTCSMHPQVKNKEPGKCPYCGMDLIPLVSDEIEGVDSRALVLSDTAKALAEVETSTVERRFPNAEIRMVGKVSYDETRLQSLTARFPGRIDRLFVNYAGIKVKQGDHLAEIYSPKLVVAQKELLTAIKYDPTGAAAESTREKLRLWDLLPAQIEEIERSGKVTDKMELKAPMGGVVVEKHVKEGDYLKTGETLFKIADLSQLWITLDAYESDITWLRYGQDVSFNVKSFSGETFTGKIVFINPVLNEKTRTVKIRVVVNNEEGRLKPGMFVRAVVYSKISSNGNVYLPELAGKYISPMHPEIIRDEPGPCPVCGMDLVPIESMGMAEGQRVLPPLVIPRSAVLRTGKRAVVYIALSSKEKNVYEGREVLLGARAGDFYIIKEGLEEGDRVVTNGAFKIDSSLQIQAKPSMMNPEGDKMSSMHNHSGMDMGSKSSVEIIGLPMEFKKDLEPVFESYFKIQKALAADDIRSAKEVALLFSTSSHSVRLDLLTAKASMAYEKIHKKLHSAISRIKRANSIDDVRSDGFEDLSLGMKNMIVQFGPIGDNSVYEMHCPMALNGGAIWLQDDKGLLNPYFGDAMLYCGDVKGILVKGNETVDGGHENHGHK